MYYMIINGTQAGPFEIEMLPSKGLRADTMVWAPGMDEWQRADSVEELLPYLPTRNTNPYANQRNNYYGGGYENPVRRKSQWMTLSIVATVLGLCSCIGLVLGIIAITKCNTANRYYAVGEDMMGESYDNSARTLAIIALIADGLGLIISMIFNSNNLI